jgi:hydroxypyruvate isomerase
MKYSLCIGAYPGKDAVYHLEKVKEHGFDGLEYYGWWELGDLDLFAAEQKRIGVGIIGTCAREFNLVDPAYREKYLNGMVQTIKACQKLGVPSIITQTGNERVGVPRELQRQAMIETLKQCTPLLESAGIVLEVEPLNGLVNHPGHYLQRSDEAVQVIDAVDHPQVKLVFDVYHQQITEGNVIRNATAYVDRIHHYHIADNPGRHQPGTGELNYLSILRAIQGTGFDGFVGLECGFKGDTDEAIHVFKSTILEQL